MSLLKKPVKPIVLVIFAILGIITGLVSSHIFFTATGSTIFGWSPATPAIKNQYSGAELTSLAFDVLEHIKEGDFNALAAAAHPDFGVVFSPSPTINLAANMRFDSAQIAQFATDTTNYVWGVRNGSGEPISLTPVEYFAQFVYSDDFINAPIIGVDRIVRSGNALENITEEFPGVRFVDFHIPGGERDTPEDLDWSTLRLGFEKHAGRLWLTVVVHSTWTV